MPNFNSLYKYARARTHTHTHTHIRYILNMMILTIFSFKSPNVSEVVHVNRITLVRSCCTATAKVESFAAVGFWISLALEAIEAVAINLIT